MESLLTIIITIFCGVSVYILGEIAHEIWLKPLEQYKQIKSEISYSLVYYANVYSNVIDLADDQEMTIESHKHASDEFRILAAKLHGFIETLFWLKPLIPPKEKLLEASQELMGLSNSFFCAYKTHETHEQNRENRQYAERIRELLGMVSNI